MDAATYWKIRALAERAEKIRSEAKWAVARAESAQAEAMQAAGLDPAKPYRFDDATQTVAPAEIPHDPQ